MSDPAPSSVPSAPPPGDGITARMLAVIARGATGVLPDGEFDALARDVFAHQFAGNAPYRAFCERRGVTPRTLTHWSDIPAVPTDAFKAAPLAVGDPSAARAVFRTSGTTQGAERRGTHYLADVALYDAALRAGFRAHLLPDGARLPLVSLVPRPADVPDSSLSHMTGAVMDDLAAPGGGWFVDTQGGIDHAGLTATLRRAEAEGTPVLLMGTAFAFVHWTDALREQGTRFRLPVGSRLMDTGGFKGRSREVTRPVLYGALSDLLGIAPEWLVNEYGMTEMSSQFYDAVAGRGVPDAAARMHVGPPWVRTQATDPETLRPLPHGETGVLRHVDLANVHSVSAIQTADLGWTSPQGFRVIGRATGAEARGCSIAMDDLLSAIAR